jgi:hypothetical protein
MVRMVLGLEGREEGPIGVEREQVSNRKSLVWWW